MESPKEPFWEAVEKRKETYKTKVIKEAIPEAIEWLKRIKERGIRWLKEGGEKIVESPFYGAAITVEGVKVGIEAGRIYAEKGRKTIENMIEGVTNAVDASRKEVIKWMRRRQIESLTKKEEKLKREIERLQKKMMEEWKTVIKLKQELKACREAIKQLEQLVG